MDFSRLDGQSLSPQAPVLARLMADLPELFSEGKLDPKKLKAALGEDAFAGQERYGLTWNGKSECFKKIQETTTKTLRPRRQESVDFDTTENLFIEGDNLQVLKVLQRSYYGQVKMIYIDPPYNTGNDFIYSDRFTRTRKEELIANGSMDAQGNIINHDLYRQNTRDSGHFHSNWLNMMYPRLFVAKSLLRPDGVIFVSIDDNEVKNLRAMMDEVFGEENFLAQFVWKRRQNVDSRTKVGASVDHEYVVCYRRGEQGRLRGAEKDMSKYSNPDNDLRGDWMSADMTGLATEDQRPNLHYDVTDPKTGITYKCPPTGWRYEKKRMQQLIEADAVIFPNKAGGRPRRKKFAKDLEDEFTGFSTVLSATFNTQGTRELRQLFGDKELFDFPKPTEFLKLLVAQGTRQDGQDTVLDFFAGSGTIAHAVMQLNAEDGGNRKWICVQLPEKCKPDTEAAKAGFVTIASIAKERIRRAGRKIREGNADKQLDTGFKVFKLDESNFKVWDTQVDGVAQLEQQLLDFVDNVRPGAQNDDLLYELILKTGLELNVAIEAREAGGGVYHRIGNGSLIICLADTLTEPLLAAMLGDRPEKIIVLDRAFADNDQLKTNLLLQAEQAGVKEFTVI
jgi:adenine-specific DNA-methyltransferase